MSGEWRVYKRKGKLWLGYQRNSIATPTGMVNCALGNLGEHTRFCWAITARAQSMRQIGNIRRVVQALDMDLAKYDRSPLYASEVPDHYALLAYLDAVASDSEAQAMLVIRSIAARLNEKGAVLYL